MMIEKFIACACFGEGLRIMYDSDDKSFSVSIWVQGYTEKTSLSNRFRHIGKILKNGQPWEDQIILQEEDAKALAEFILKPPSVEAKP